MASIDESTGVPKDSPIESLDASSASRLLRSLRDPGVALAADPDLPQLEGYVLTARLGQGSGGEVFLGHRSGSQRELAIKLLHHPLGSIGARLWPDELDR